LQDIDDSVEAFRERARKKLLEKNEQLKNDPMLTGFDLLVTTE
jgi:hypothetical protein